MSTGLTSKEAEVRTLAVIFVSQCHGWGDSAVPGVWVRGVTVDENNEDLWKVTFFVGGGLQNIVRVGVLYMTGLIQISGTVDRCEWLRTAKVDRSGNWTVKDHGDSPYPFIDIHKPVIKA